MKLQVGLIYSDGATATHGDCLRILGDFLYRPAETAGEIADGPLAISYRGDRITPEEEFETQPLRYGPFILTFDGRLDNREDLTSRLGISNQQNLSDPLLVANIYEKFGDAGFPALIGEFAISLWCRNTRSLRLIRSACGSRPLYYIFEKGRLVWSSDFAHLVRISRLDLDIDEGYAVQYLVSDPNGSLTALKKVRAVTRGSILHFHKNGSSSKQFLWSPNSIQPVHYSTDEQYEEHCRAVLTEAVKVRLRVRGNLFSELSGGFDSSSVVLLGDKLLRARHRESPTLRTLSCIYTESQTCDERPFIRTIEEWRKNETVQINEQEQNITLGLLDPDFTGLPSPLHCFPGRYRAFSKVMRHYNAKVLLTGLGGDHLFWSSCDGTAVIADQMRAWNIPQAHTACKTWSTATGLPYLELFARAVSLCFRSNYLPPKIPSWLAPKHKARFEAETAEDCGFMHRHMRPSQRAKIRLIEHLFTVVAAGYMNDYCDIHVTHPYTH